jgi:hypothetical protein
MATSSAALLSLRQAPDLDYNVAVVGDLRLNLDPEFKECKSTTDFRALD